jgi:hypothetical protein
MPRLSFFVAFLFITPLLLAACNNAGGSLPDAELPGEEEDAPPPEDIVSGIGTIQYVELEGGFYGLVADDSTRYNPQNLDEAYREDGLRVRFRGTVEDDVMTTQMWGQVLQILEMQRMNDQ